MFLGEFVSKEVLVVSIFQILINMMDLFFAIHFCGRGK